MNKYIPAEELIAEIERRKNQTERRLNNIVPIRRKDTMDEEQLAKIELRDKVDKAYLNGVLITLSDILHFITSLQQEQPTSGYDEAYLNECIAKARKTWKGVDVDKYMDEMRGREQEQPDNEDIDKVAQELYEHLYELKRRNNVPTNLYDKQEIIDLWKAGVEYGRNHPKQEQPKLPGYNKALLDVKSKVDELYEETSIGLSEYDSGLYNGIAETCMKLRGFIKARLESDEQPVGDLEKAANHVYESWMGGTMDDVRRDMVELGKVLNARKK